MTKLSFIIIAIIIVIVTAPFNFLAPDDSIYLIKALDNGKLDFLAQGPKTLYYQWQSWLWIGLILMVIFFISLMFLIFIFRIFDTRYDEIEKEKQETIDEYEELMQNLEKRLKVKIEQELKERINFGEALIEEAREIDSRTDQKIRNSQYRIYQAEKELTDATLKMNAFSNQKKRIKKRETLLKDYLNHKKYKIKTDIGQEIVTFDLLMKLARKHNMDQKREKKFSTD